MSEDSGPTDAGQMTGKQAVIWTWLVSMAATTGLICLYARWGWQGVVTGAALATALSLFAGLAVWIADGPGKSVRAGRRALAAALLATASIGLVAVFDLAGVFVVLLLAGSAPALTSLVRRRWPRGDHPAAAPGGVRGRAHLSSPVALDVTGEDQAAQARRRLRADRRPDVVPRLARQLRCAQRRQVDGGSPFRRSAAGRAYLDRAVSPIPSRARCVVRVRSPRIQQPAPLPHRPGQSS